MTKTNLALHRNPLLHSCELRLFLKKLVTNSCRFYMHATLLFQKTHLDIIISLLCTRMLFSAFQVMGETDHFLSLDQKYAAESGPTESSFPRIRQGVLDKLKDLKFSSQGGLQAIYSFAIIYQLPQILPRAVIAFLPMHDFKTPNCPV